MTDAAATASLAAGSSHDAELLVRSPRIRPECALRIAERALLAGTGVSDRALLRFPAEAERDALRLAFGAEREPHREVLDVAARWQVMHALLSRLAADPDLPVLLRARWLLVDWDGGMYAIEQQRDDRDAMTSWREALASLSGETDEFLRDRLTELAGTNPEGV